MNDKTTDAMLDPTWTRERGYSHADGLLEILRRADNAKGGDNMARKKTTQVVEDLDELEELEEMEEDEDEVEETPKEKTPTGIRPEDLAKELGISGKQIRAFLRRTFPRPLDQKRSSWFLTEKQAQAVRDHFAPEEEEEDDE